MSWHHPDMYFFLCLAGSLAAFLAPTIIDEVTGTIDDLFGRKRNPPVVEPRRSNEKAVDLPSLPDHPPPPPKKYLENVKPLDGLQRDRPSPLFESIKDLPPEAQASRVQDHFGIFGGARPAKGRSRKRK